MEEVYLGLGSNKGDREENIQQAVNFIKNFPETNLKEISGIYETEPWGYTDQQRFLNLCVKIETNLSPYKLLERCQAVEEKLERKREIRWGPRTIDVDILIYGERKIEGEDLIIPHPRIQKRAFVLVPLYDLDENLVIKGENIKIWLNKVDKEGINEYKNYKEILS